MLTIFRRHRKDCPHRQEGRSYRRCACPVWVDGLVGGVEIRKSLRRRNWESALDLARQWEAEDREPQPEVAPLTIEAATQAWLDDAEARGLRAGTMDKLKVLVKQFREFARCRGVLCLLAFALEDLRAFRASWADAPLAASKKLERLRSFYRFAQESAWVPENLAAKLRRPVVPVKPTLPFSPDEMQAMLGACDFYPDKLNALRLRALVLLLRYSGLRIGDAASLPVSRIQAGSLFLYTAKTGTPVRLPLPPVVLDALAMVPRVSAAHYFWSGESKKETLPWIWGRSLAKLFKLAKVKNGHAHRLRDTFAVELLQRGVPIERVSMLLGHSSIKTTEKHYNPWIRARQEQLEADVRGSWGADAGVLAATKGTPRVHGQRRVM